MSAPKLLDGIVSVQPVALMGVKAGIKIHCRSAQPMSLMGQTEKFGCSTGRSALPSTTDIVSQVCQVRKVQILLQKSKIERL
jgi:hypothetical protein